MPTKADTRAKQNANLKPFKKGERTSEEQVKLAKKAGIASGKARKEQKLFKEEILKRMKEDDWNEIILNLIERSKGSDKSLEVLRDTIGQKPKEQIEATIDEVRIKVAIK